MPPWGLQEVFSLKAVMVGDWQLGNGRFQKIGQLVKEQLLGIVAVARDLLGT